MSRRNFRKNSVIVLGIGYGIAGALALIGASLAASMLLVLVALVGLAVTIAYVQRYSLGREAYKYRYQTAVGVFTVLALLHALQVWDAAVGTTPTWAFWPEVAALLVVGTFAFAYNVYAVKKASLRH